MSKLISKRKSTQKQINPVQNIAIFLTQLQKTQINNKCIKFNAINLPSTNLKNAILNLAEKKWVHIKLINNIPNLSTEHKTTIWLMGNLYTNMMNDIKTIIIEQANKQTISNIVSYVVFDQCVITPKAYETMQEIDNMKYEYKECVLYYCDIILENNPTVTISDNNNRLSFYFLTLFSNKCVKWVVNLTYYKPEIQFLNKLLDISEDHNICLCDTKIYIDKFANFLEEKKANEDSINNMLIIADMTQEEMNNYINNIKIFLKKKQELESKFNKIIAFLKRKT